MAKKKPEEGDKENVYEQKIKEEDQRRARMFRKERERLKNNLMAGVFFAVPVLLLVGFIYQKTRELEHMEQEKFQDDQRKAKLRSNAPKFKLKQLYP